MSATLFDLRSLSLADMYACSTELRSFAQKGSDSDDIARQVVSYFFDRLVASDSGRQCVMVRLFRTHAGADGNALSLRATRGVEPAWNDPAASKNHRHISLESKLLESQMPMVRALLTQLGEPAKLISDAPSEPMDRMPMFDVFHVEHAPGSPFVTAQRDFVEPYGVKSILGFGGALSTSELFIVVLFANVSIPKTTAQLFRTLAPSIGLALLTNDDGRIARASHAYEEVLRHQERLALERHQELRQSTELVNALIETTPDCVKLIARDGTILRINASGAAMIGAPSPEVLVGRIGYDIVAPEHREAYRKFNEHICDGGKGAFEFDVLGLDGMRRKMDSRSVPFRLGDATVQLSVTRDVTAERAADEKLRDASRRKDEFIATLSHELRNPLASLRNALTLSSVRKLDEREAKHVHRVMDQQVSHLSKLVDDLLDVSRIDRGMLKLQRESVELAALVRSAIETAEPLIHAAGHRVEIELPSHAIWLTGDRLRLMQILSNLLSNAARFTKVAGCITIRANEDDDAVEIAVRDTGIGFTEEASSGLFEMFAKSDSSDGLGIGLALTRRLVALHGGSIAAHSRGIDLGAEFVVRLPRSQDVNTPNAATTLPEIAPIGRCRVLIADDNRDAAKMLAGVLEALGSDVAVAHDGIEAVALARTTQPDLVLLDIGMPGLDGYQAASRIRSEADGGKTMRIVALTGWGQEEDRRRTQAAGFDEHLVKPTDLATLRRLLANVKRAVS